MSQNYEKISEESKLFSSRIASDDIYENHQKKKKIKKYSIIIGIILLIIIITVIIVVATKKKKTDPQKQEKPPEKEEEISKYYSETTKNYINFIKTLEKSDQIIYHWDFKNGLKNKYSQKITEGNETYETTLHLHNRTFEPYYLTEENIITKEVEEMKFYKEHPEKMQKSYVFGPTNMIDQSFIEGQKMTSECKIHPKIWGGMTLILHIKNLNLNNNSDGRIFGWGSLKEGEPGFCFQISWGVMNMHIGKGNVFVGWRLFERNQFWHQIIISVRKAEENDIEFLKIDIKNIKIGDVFYEVFHDGVSKKNVSTTLLDDYGELLGWDLSNNTRMVDNENFYMGHVMVLKRGIKLNEALLLNSTVVQPTKDIIPVTKDRRCNMPGVKFGPLPSQIYYESKEKLAPEIKFLHLTEKWSCLGINYINFFKARMEEYCGENLRKLDFDTKNGNKQEWEQKMIYNLDYLDVWNYYFPEIKNHLQNLTSFKAYLSITSTDKNGNDLKMHEIVNYGAVLNSEGLITFEKFHKEINGTVTIQSGNNKYYTYFELKEPYMKDRIYTIKVLNSKEEKFIYDDKKLISHAIKVNQVGYSPIVKKHFAYVGRWLGTFGELPLDSYVNKTFYLYNKNNQEVYKNNITWRSEKDNLNFSSDWKIFCKINGEVTLLLDFSNFTQKGDDFYIYIPKIGRSFPFSISNKAVFKNFYTTFRGLFHQRTGSIRQKPYTNWEMGAHHKGIYVSHHIPNELHYNNYITNDRTKEVYRMNHFTMIEATKTDEFWGDVYGGHADAGDFDNRPYHLRIIENLAALWFKKKDVLFDKQFNIPDGGNGVPDILKEMEWNLQIHYKIQEKFKDGSVSTWIEASSHPGNFKGDPGMDTQRYYVGLRTRENTLEYVVAAGVMALSFEFCDYCPKNYSEKWKKSAEKAWEWAIKEENKCVYKFNYSNENLTYNEPELIDYDLARAALIMYKLSNKNAKFKKYLFNDTASKIFEQKYTSGMQKLWDGRKYGIFKTFPIIFFLDDEDFDLYLRKLRFDYYGHINNILNNQKNGTQYTYRNAYFYPYNHPFYSSIGWGNFIGGQQIEILIMGLLLFENVTEYQETYKELLQSLSYYYDFNFGCNHYGRSFTTGLGQIYPLKFVSHPNYWFVDKRIYDPIPGIPLYFFNGNLHFQEILKVHKIEENSNHALNFKGFKIYPSPFFFNFTNEPAADEVREYLMKNIPFWHRTSNLEELTIENSEFSVWETVSRMVILNGFLLDKDEKGVRVCDRNSCPSIFPTEDILGQKPKDMKDSLCNWQIP